MGEKEREWRCVLRRVTNKTRGRCEAEVCLWKEWRKEMCVYELWG